jgi:hypothetical protein
VTEEPQLDRERVENLMAAILTAINENCQRGPAAPTRVFEALSALAASAALVIEGSENAGAHGEAREFFARATIQHLGSYEIQKVALALRCCAKAIARLERVGLRRDAAQIREELSALGVEVQIMPDPITENQ